MAIYAIKAAFYVEAESEEEAVKQWDDDLSPYLKVNSEVIDT